MIILKAKHEIDLMREAGIISARALRLGGKSVEPGISTLEIDTIIRKYIESQGAKPNFLGVGGFPGSACISINEEVIHGIPDKKHIIKAGDIVSIDTGAAINGFNGDNADTFGCGDISKEAKNLIETTRQCFFEAYKNAVAGNRLGDIGYAAQRCAEACGYSVVRDYVGHGIGASLHEDPSVPNFGKPGRGIRLMPGMTIAIEPMVNMGTPMVDVMPNGWTVKTRDRKLSAHYENTIAITANGPEILTNPDA